MNDEVSKVGRLALRPEGENWNAYYAMPDTMADAIFLGSIKMAFVGGNEERKLAFMALMRECVADVIQEAVGVRPTFPDGPQSAPESERAGHG